MSSYTEAGIKLFEKVKINLMYKNENIFHYYEYGISYKKKSASISKMIWQDIQSKLMFIFHGWIVQNNNAY